MARPVGADEIVALHREARHEDALAAIMEPLTGKDSRRTDQTDQTAAAVRLLNELALASMQRGAVCFSFEAAFAYLRRAQKLLNVSPGLKAVTLNNLSIYHSRTQQPHAAERCLQRALELVGGSARAHGAHADGDDISVHICLNLTTVLADVGRHRDSLSMAQQAVKALGRQKKPSAGSTRPDPTIQLASAAYYNLAVQQERLRTGNGGGGGFAQSYRAAIAEAKRGGTVTQKVPWLAAAHAATRHARRPTRLLRAWQTSSLAAWMPRWLPPSRARPRSPITTASLDEPSRRGGEASVAMVDFVEKAYAQAQERAQALPALPAAAPTAPTAPTAPPARPQTAAPRAPSAPASSPHRPPSGTRRPASAGAPVPARSGSAAPRPSERLGRIAETSAGQAAASSEQPPASASASPGALATTALASTLSAAYAPAAELYPGAPATASPRPLTSSPRTRAASASHSKPQRQRPASAVPSSAVRSYSASASASSPRGGGRASVSLQRLGGSSPPRLGSQYHAASPPRLRAAGGGRPASAAATSPTRRRGRAATVSPQRRTAVSPPRSLSASRRATCQNGKWVSSSGAMASSSLDAYCQPPPSHLGGAQAASRGGSAVRRPLSGSSAVSGGGVRSLAAARTASAQRAVSRYSVHGGKARAGQQAEPGPVPAAADGAERDGAVMTPPHE